MADKYTEITIKTRQGTFRRTLARIEKIVLYSGEERWQVITKGGLTVGGVWHKSEKEAAQALKFLHDLGLPEARAAHKAALKLEVGKGVNTALFDSIIRRQIYLEQYKAGLFNSTKPILSRAIEDMIRKIDALPNNTTRARYERVLLEIQRINAEMSNKLAKKLQKDLSKLSENERYFITGAMQSAIPAEVAIKIGLPSVGSLRRIAQVEPFQGFVLDEWTKQIGASATRKARQQLYIGLAEGDSVPKIVRRMKFIGDQTTRDLNMVVRTAVNHVTNQVKSSVFQENADVLKGVMWRATLDSRTSDICASRDGQVYPVDDHPTPPAHPNCRSVIVPLVKSYRDLGLDIDDLQPGTRASMNGQVPATETYDSWLRQQPREFVYDVLGPGKGKIFLDGGLTLDKFVDSTGKSLTIEQLEELI